MLDHRKKLAAPASGDCSAQNIETVMKFRTGLIGYEPSTRGEEIVLAETFRQFNAFVEARRARLASVATGIPAAMWWVVAIGAILDIGLILLVDMELQVDFIFGRHVGAVFGNGHLPDRGARQPVPRRCQRRAKRISRNLRDTDVPQETPF
jgi:hypothetical protein